MEESELARIKGDIRKILREWAGAESTRTLEDVLIEYVLKERGWK